MGVCGERMGRRIDPAERGRVLAGAAERSRESRWSAPGRARVIHPDHGTVVVPHSSNLAAIMNAAEVWRCDWAEITDAQVWAAEPGDVPVKITYIVGRRYEVQYPIKWVTQEEDTHPYYFAGMALTFAAPAIFKEVPET